MNLSTRSLRWFGLLLVAVVAAGCAQSGSGDLPLPTAPGSVSTGPRSSVPSGTIATLGPGASYDATGLWHLVISDVHGNVAETFDANFTQDSEGNISFIDEDGVLITFTRLGTGVVITYRLSLTDEATPCDFNVHGTLRLDTRTNTLTGNAVFRDIDCDHGVQFVTGTKMN